MKISYVQLGREKRPVCFSLSAIEDIQDTFGSLGKMREELTAGNVKAINSVLEIMLKAGRIYAEANGEDCPPPLKCRPGDLIGTDDIDIVSEIFAAIGDGTERKVEAKSKN